MTPASSSKNATNIVSKLWPLTTGMAASAYRTSRARTASRLKEKRSVGMVVKGSCWFPLFNQSLKNSGSFAMFAAMRLASSGVSALAASAFSAEVLK